MNEQKVLNNHIHNTLKITKGEIREMVEKQAKQIAEKWAKKHVEDCLSRWDLREIFREEIAKMQDKGYESSDMFDTEPFNKFIADELRGVLMEEVVRKIKFSIEDKKEGTVVVPPTNHSGNIR